MNMLMAKRKERKYLTVVNEKGVNSEYGEGYMWDVKWGDKHNSTIHTFFYHLFVIIS